MSSFQRLRRSIQPLAVPGVRLVRTYRRAWLSGDIVAGVVLTALLVPQGMAYAELAGLPPVTGLYTTVLALLAYALFGPSRILVLGPDSALGPLIAAALLPLVDAQGDPARAVALASMLALLMGALCIAAGFARLGVLARAPVEAGPRRLPQRDRGDRLRRAASEAVRLQLRRARARRTRSTRSCAGCATARTVPASLAVGVGVARGDPRLSPLAAEGARRPGRRGRRCDRGGRLRPHRARRVSRRRDPVRLPGSDRSPT